MVYFSRRSWPLFQLLYTFITNAFAFQGHLLVNDDSKRCAFFGSYGATYSFYDIENIKTPKTLIEQAPVIPIYEDVSDGDMSSVAFDGQLTVNGARCLAKSKNHCFCLYSGELLGEAKSLYYGDKLLIFDWDGNPLQIIYFDQKYNSITYNEEKQELYLLGIDPLSFDYTISKLDMSKL